MKKKINFGIGFITGRPNICDIINNYYKYIIEQVKELEVEVNFTIFILYDLNYLNVKREEFYKILPEVHEKVKIEYITPEDVEKEKQNIMKKYSLTEQEAGLFIGKGYARARNTMLYKAVEQKVDYLLFWDDDEYPLANVKQRSRNKMDKAE